MKRVSLKRILVAFSLFVAGTVLYVITSQAITCSIQIYFQNCALYTAGEIIQNKVVQAEAPQTSSLQISATDLEHREVLGWENPPSETLLAEQKRFVLILIMSAPNNKIRRSAIRQTWLSTLNDNPAVMDLPNIRAIKDPVNASNNLLIEYFFACGHHSEPSVESEVEHEIRLYGDILRLGYTESYTLLVQKTLTSLKFASTMNVKFVVKIDDDVYLNVPGMVWWLKTASLPEKLYAGHLLYRSRAIRRERSKYYVGRRDYNETFFPVYCNGPFYILSKNAVVELLLASNSTRTFPLEDAYLGVLARKVGIVPFELRNKRILMLYRLKETVERDWDDSKLNQFFALGDSLSPERLFAFHRRYVNMTVSYL